MRYNDSHMNTSLFWKRFSIGAIGLLALVAIIVNISPIQKKLFPHSLYNTESVSVETQEIKPVRIIFTGDIMLDRGVKSSVIKNYNGDYSKLFEQVTWFKNADIVFGNLEGPVSDIGNNVGSEYSFRMDPKILNVLKNVGFSVVSFANNHVGDWNTAAFIDTLRRLEESSFVTVGAGKNSIDSEQVRIVEKNGMKIGFLGFSDVGPNWMVAKKDYPGILLASNPRRSEIISTAKSQVDFLIVSYHWGDEYTPFNDRQKTLAETSIDAGADLIIGHHPHVVQDYSTYKDKLIFYSLGNFIFDQSFSPETQRGLIVDLTINPDGTYQNIELLTSQQDKTYRINETRTFERETETVLKKEPLDKKPTCPKPLNINQPDKFLFPVSQVFSLGNYIPSHLEIIPETIPTRNVSIHCLTTNTIKALENMVTDAKNLQLSLVVSSAYRSSSIQQTLFSNNQNVNPTQEFPTVAKPEHSEHQLGTAVDFRSGTSDEFTLQGFGLSPEYTWMKQNAYLYGFVQSYPTGKELVTGYAAESWHWRYVGIDHATAIRDSSLTPYEYLQNLIEQ